MERLRELVSGTSQTTLDKLRGLVSKNKRRYTHKGFNLDLSYISNNLIAMGFPADGIEGLYRNPLKAVRQLLALEHGGRYKVYNLCAERVYRDDRFEYVCHMPIDEQSVPPFAVLCAFCSDVHAFLEAHPDHVAVVHCKTGKGRTGMMLAAYLIHSGACLAASQALSYFGARRTFDANGVTLPSQRRWVGYYERYLEPDFDEVEARKAAYRLRRIDMNSLPTGCTKLFVGVFMRGKSVFYVRDAKADRYSPSTLRFECGGVMLKDDVKIIFYNGSTKNVLFSFWLHSYFLGAHVTLHKSEIDGAHKDKLHKRFKVNFRVTLHCAPYELDDVRQELVPMHGVTPRRQSILLTCGRCELALGPSEPTLTLGRRLFHWKCATCDCCQRPLSATADEAVMRALTRREARVLCGECDVVHLEHCSQCDRVLHGFTSDEVLHIGTLCRACFQCALCLKPLVNADDPDFDPTADRWEVVGERLVCAIHTAPTVTEAEARLRKHQRDVQVRERKWADRRTRLEDFIARQSMDVMEPESDDSASSSDETSKSSLKGSGDSHAIAQRGGGLGDLAETSGVRDSAVVFQHRMHQHQHRVSDVAMLIDDVLAATQGVEAMPPSDCNVLDALEQELINDTHDLGRLSNLRTPRESLSLGRQSMSMAALEAELGDNFLTMFATEPVAPVPPSLASLTPSESPRKPPKTRSALMPSSERAVATAGHQRLVQRRSSLKEAPISPRSKDRVYQRRRTLDEATELPLSKPCSDDLMEFLREADRLRVAVGTEGDVRGSFRRSPIPELPTVATPTALPKVPQPRLEDELSTISGVVSPRVRPPRTAQTNLGLQMAHSAKGGTLHRPIIPATRKDPLPVFLHTGDVDRGKRGSMDVLGTPLTARKDVLALEEQQVELSPRPLLPVDEGELEVELESLFNTLLNDVHEGSEARKAPVQMGNTPLSSLVETTSFAQGLVVHVNKSGVVPKHEPTKKVVLASERLKRLEQRLRRKSLFQTAPSPANVMEQMEQLQSAVEPVSEDTSGMESAAAASSQLSIPQGQHAPVASSSGLPVCFACREPIHVTGAPSLSMFYLTVNGRLRYYHPEHFACVTCHRHIAAHEEFMTSEGYVNCYACYIAMNAPRCRMCRKPIVGQYCEVVDVGCYHDACFQCHKCATVLGNAAFYLDKGRPSCTSCRYFLVSPQ